MVGLGPVGLRAARRYRMSRSSPGVPSRSHFYRCMHSGSCAETAGQARHDLRKAGRILVPSQGLIGGASRYGIIRGNATPDTPGNYAVKKIIRFQPGDARLVFTSKMSVNEIPCLVAWRGAMGAVEPRLFL